MTDQAAFEGTIRTLDADNFRSATVAVLLVGAVIGVWTWWMFSARVSVQSEMLSPATLALRAAGVGNR